MTEPTNGSPSPFPPPASAEVMREAIAAFAAKNLEERVAILKEIGILDEAGDMAPEYCPTEDEAA